MLRCIVRLTPTFIFPIMDRRNEYDHNELHSESLHIQENGMDRLKRMFSKNEFEEASVEIHSVVQGSMLGAFAGACLGGFVQSRLAYLYFIENNQATIFKTPMQAKKKLQDFVTLAFAKGAYKWGWRLGIFTGVFSLIATSIQVYNGEPGLVEYVTAGTVTGAIYKANLGLAATMVGAGTGAVLSTVGGLAILFLYKISGASIDDIRRALYTIKEAREDQMNQVLEKSATIKNDSLTKHHDELVKSKGQVTIEQL